MTHADMKLLILLKDLEESKMILQEPYLSMFQLKYGTCASEREEVFLVPPALQLEPSCTHHT